MTEPVFSSALQTLMEEFSRSGVRELHVRSGNFEVYLSSDPTGSRLAAGPIVPAKPQSSPSPARSTPTPTVQPVPPAASAAEVLPADAIIVRAPNLGTFYRAPKPGAANYVEVGSIVSAGDDVCLIEVMKLFTAVRSEAGGKVHAVLATDGAMVEAGQPLFALVRN
ncbi:acetyl-CoA carboxylase biotin carboxyl carrier protein [Sphingobium yanoikuyae]|jgi:acetyl-CoA carboxylase biotin carboxyl carrier protein|uniref:acetyl-CoA carboxylase biotin carboxyl carrier protein n=1 Tax=Sphingobium yanoikuyae TaxID=13690 RepID=UPI000847735F|nr:biotin/lipoyl-containing protein [Sphingobium yanoikuyae]